MTNQETRTRIEEIIWCEGQADQVVEDASRERSNLRWRAAKLITEELKAGTSQRDLAKRIGKSHAHVGYMNEIYLTCHGHLGGHERTFDSLYKEVQDKPKSDTTYVDQVKDKPEIDLAFIDSGQSEMLNQQEICDDNGCPRIDVFGGIFSQFKAFGKLAFECWEIHEDIEQLEKMERILKSYTTKAAKIRRDNFNGNTQAA